MLYKNTISAGYDNNTPHIFPLEMYDYPLLKSATEMHPEIAAYIQKAKPVPGKTIVLVDALGAGEYWGSNSNGDFFAENQLAHDGLDYGYKTFMEYAYPYIEHMNEATVKDPKRRMGDRVNLAVYFTPMHRVQLIITINRGDKTRMFLDRIDAGDYPDVSMACGVQYDKCSICGSLHRVKSDYCTHARTMLNQILPDGRKVYLYNIKPRFHDISLVFLGAEKNSKVLLKVANKQASIRKNVQLQVTDSYSVPAMLDEKTMKLLSKYPIEDVAATMKHMGLQMSPQEFQYLMLSKVNQKQASDLYHSGTCFDPNIYDTTVSMPSGRVDSRIQTILDHRPLSKEAAIPGIFNTIVAPVMSGLYHALGTDVPSVIVNAVDKMNMDGLQKATALGYVIGNSIASNIIDGPPELNLPMTPPSSPFTISTIGIPYSSEPLLKFGSSLFWNAGKSWGQTPLERLGTMTAKGFTYAHQNPLVIGGIVGTAKYLLQRKKIDDMIASGSGEVSDIDGNPKNMFDLPVLKGLMYGLGTYGALKGLNYLVNRGRS